MWISARAARHRPAKPALAAAAALLVAGCSRPLREGPTEAVAVSHENQAARRVLCGDIGMSACLAACPDSLSPTSHAECLLDMRFGSDRYAHALALRLYGTRGTLVGLDTRGTIEGIDGKRIGIVPALPLAEDAHHLDRIDASLGEYSDFVACLSARSERRVAFEARPETIVFFRTSEPGSPLAYYADGSIAYNVDRPSEDLLDLHDILFHQLFHMNDERLGMWSERVLSPVFEAIVGRCGDEDECYALFTPHESALGGGTFYAFDPHTRDVREYAAELAVRYFVEQRAVLDGSGAETTPFKCITRENARAWSLVVDEIFGGVDLTRVCSPDEISSS